MDTKETISKEISSLYDEGLKLSLALQGEDQNLDFHSGYQRWYTRALRVVEVLARDRYQEFRSYYEADAKRKNLDYETYVIQDYLKGLVPSKIFFREFDTKAQALMNFVNQLTILDSLADRVDSVLARIVEELYSEVQDAELETSRKLAKISVRAAGSLAGVVLETYLQKLAKRRGVTMAKKNPTISELNDLLRKAGVLDIPIWRKISYLADIRNLCSHKKDAEPSKEQVEELIEGANWVIKNIF